MSISSASPCSPSSTFLFLSFSILLFGHVFRLCGRKITSEEKMRAAQPEDTNDCFKKGASDQRKGLVIDAK